MYSLLVETDYCLSQQYSTKIRFSFCQTTIACLQLFLSGRKKLSDEEIQELKEESESDINDQASEGTLCNLFKFQKNHKTVCYYSICLLMKHMKSSQLLLHYIPNFEERGLKADKYSIEKSLQEARKKNKLTGQVLVMGSHI